MSEGDAILGHFHRVERAHRRLKRRWRAAVLLLLLFSIACSSRKQANPLHSSTATPETGALTGAREPAEASESYTAVNAHHVIFREKSGLHLRAEWLQGRLYPAHPGIIPSLDDPRSFRFEIEQGRTEIRLDELSAVLRDGALRDSKLRGIRIAALGPDELELHGTYHELVPLPVRLTGKIAATADGRIEIHVQSLKVLKIPFKGMLRAMHLRPGTGIQAGGDSIYLRTDELLPPPRKTGHITAVHFTADGRLEEDYGGKPEAPQLEAWDRSKWRNYIRLSGGTIRFGKLTMRNADLALLDTSPGDWFEFDLARYRDQLVHGDMRMTPAGGLQIFVPDITKLAAR